LPLDVELIVEKVHQHRLAAPDRTPEIDAARGLGLATGDPPQEAAAPRRCLQFGLQLVQSLSGGALLGIGLEFPSGNEGIIGRKDRCHFGLAFRIVPEKLRTIWPSSSPCTTSPRRNMS